MSWRTKQEVKKKIDDEMRIYSPIKWVERFISRSLRATHTHNKENVSFFTSFSSIFLLLHKKITHTHTDQLDVVPRHAQIPFSLRGITLPVKWSRGMSFLHKKSIKFPNITKDGSILKKKKENLMRWHVTSEHRKLMELLSIEFLVAALSH